MEKFLLSHKANAVKKCFGGSENWKAKERLQGGQDP